MNETTKTFKQRHCSAIDPNKLDRICKLTETQSHIALLTTADMIHQYCNEFAICFDRALDIAESY